MTNQNQYETEHFQGLDPTALSVKHKLDIVQNSRKPQNWRLSILSYHCFLKTDKHQDMNFCLKSGNSKIPYLEGLSEESSTTSCNVILFIPQISCAAVVSSWKKEYITL